MNRKGPWEGYRWQAKRRLARCPLRAHFHRERDIWVRGSYFPMKLVGGHVLSSWRKSLGPLAF